MSRINPIYLVVLCVAIFLFTLYLLINQKDSYTELKDSYAEVSAVAEELVSLKKAYTKKFRLSSYESKHLKSKNTKSGVIISSDKVDAKILNALMRKILNNNYELKALDMKKLDESSVKLYMEIQW